MLITVRIICHFYLWENEFNIQFSKLDFALIKLIEPKQMKNTIKTLLEKKWIFNECFQLYKELKIYDNILNFFNK